MDQESNKQLSLTSPISLLRVEGFIWFLVTLYLYYALGGSWSLFFTTFLLPDLTIAAYLFGPKVGAACYNAAHIEVWPAILVALSFLLGMPVLLLLGVVWFCHINFDRMMGFGLKYKDNFKKTHLGDMAL